MVEIALLQPNREEEYEAFLKTNEHALLYSSLKYRDLLRQIVDGEACYLVAQQGGRLVGVFPAFLKRNSKYGNVLNSLPFYGSNGGITVDETLSPKEQKEVRKKLLEGFYELEKQHDCVSSTIITSPFEKDKEFYRQRCSYDFLDYRIGQVVFLPKDCTDDRYNNPLMDMFDTKRRNGIRKAFKSGVSCEISDDIGAFEFLRSQHEAGMEAIGGIAKREVFFQSVREKFKAGEDYKLFVAKRNGELIAALLLLYFNKTAEYFVPVTKPGCREFNPLSLLIYESMKDAISNGFEFYNLGGTWESMKGVYLFKKKWGAKDMQYIYLIKLNRPLEYFRELGKGKLLEEFEHFYVLPFNKLQQQ